MTERRIQLNTIVSNQLPSYVREEFPLISEFLKQYYIAQEFQGAPIDLIQNIDQYIKLNETTNLTESVILSGDISFDDSTINVDLVGSPNGTLGFPDSYGLLKINDEIITYTSKTSSSFLGCIRGFSGITSYREGGGSNNLVFNETESSEHISGSQILNLSCLFLKEFLAKTKFQFLPGFEGRDLNIDLDQNLFIKQAKDFYSSKGTDRSFEILFGVLYNEEAKIVKPRDYLFTPSNSNYRITNDLVVESIEGDVTKLNRSTLRQDSYGDTITKAYAPITNIERISSETGQEFYKLKFDSGYNRDIIVDGAVYGNFSVHPKTKVIGNVSANSPTIDVDSTVGFPKQGELYVTYDDNTVGVVSYSSKSITQFYGCSNISGTILDKSFVGINTYAYGIVGDESSQEIIKVRINSVISGFDYPENTYYYSPGNFAQLKTQGASETGFKFTNWFYNVASQYKVNALNLLDSSNNVYEVTVSRNHYFNIGDSLTFFVSDDSSFQRSTTVINVSSEKSFSIRGQGVLDTNKNYTIRKNISKASSQAFPLISNFASNVQNVYVDGEKVLVASSSLPTYLSQEINATDRSSTCSLLVDSDGSTFKLSNIKTIYGSQKDDHGFYTGDSIYYSSEDDNLVPNGIFFIKRVSKDSIKLARSRSDIFNSKFITGDVGLIISSVKIEPYSNYSKLLQSSKILREISIPINDGNFYETEPGYSGILVNGVEVLNYKSNDFVYYGKINKIDVLSGGFGFDVINPPDLYIEDSVGTGATGYVSVLGELNEIRVLDSGFDYFETPTVSITGGNGFGAVASVNMKFIDNEVFFNSEDVGEVSIGSTSTIGFGTYHKFRNAERVIYKTGSQSSIGGIVAESSYFVSVQNPTTVQLHNTQEDAIAGINAVVFTSYGQGTHSIKSYNKKSVVDSISVISSGSGYENKKRTTNSAGISTSLNQITIPNHDYQSGEIVKYNTQGSVIGGLTNDSEYYVTKIDNDNLKLSLVGVGDEDKTFFYDTKQYINFSSVGVGTHVFNYPEISVTLNGRVGISSLPSESFEAKVQPIFRGTITSVHLSNNGVGYGSSEIINFNKKPNIYILTGQGAQLQPIINDGKIIEVLVLNSGKFYNSPPDLIVDGDGDGAILVPVVNNGSLTSVKVIESGSGYSQSNTTLSVNANPPTDFSVDCELQSWRINLFEKNFNNFTPDDGYISPGINREYGLQYSHIYAPRKLRESVFSVDQSGEIVYGKKDLLKINRKESLSQYHSPIIGWAYDGNPIYGPYGYSNKSGGVIELMKSGYVLDANLKENRPPLDVFPAGFFVEDYTYKKVSDDSVLDENNGRFCVTPEFPLGTYAYFATVDNSSTDTSGPFNGYRRPVFPYLIGDNFKSKPIDFNYRYSSNQDDYDLNSSSWIRNTSPYNLEDSVYGYEYLTKSNKLNQIVEIKSVLPGRVDNVGIESGGFDYKVNDRIVFDNENTRGNGATALVSRVLGEKVNTVSFATSSISNVELYPSDQNGKYVVFSENPHNFENGDIVNISGLSTTSSRISESFIAGITSSNFVLTGTGLTSSGIGSAAATGIVTYFNVYGNLSYPNIRENDILSIGFEKVKVLNVDPKLSRIRVIREYDGTVGTAHSVTSVLYENPRKLLINAGFNTTINYKLDKEIYFDPIESVGLGTLAGVGIGTTISFSNPGAGITQIFIPTKSLYLKNHGLETGDELEYSFNNGSPIDILEEGSSTPISLSDNQKIFVAKLSDDLIGIATVRVGLDTTGVFVGIASTLRNSRTLFFTGIGTGSYHSFKTNYLPITGDIFRTLVTVSTAQSHGLLSNDRVFVEVNPSIASTFTFSYNDYNRKLLVNSKDFISSGINTSTNSINISNHGFKTGDKVVHTSSSPAGGLLNDNIYYIVKVDENNIKLSDNYFSSTLQKPNIVGISSTSFGTISQVNPPIEAYRSSTLDFDLSDSSLSYIKNSSTYPAFELNFYLDENFTNIFEKNSEDEFFSIDRTGVVGTPGAKVSLIINENTPRKLYYSLDPLFESDIPKEKREINIDYEVYDNNSLSIKSSLYNGLYQITKKNDNNFTYTVANKPERSFYISTSSGIYYETDSLNAKGPISKIYISNRGSNYYSLPGISTINSTLGSGAILEVSSETIGKINKTKIKDIGFDFSSDKTARPSTSLPQLLKLESLYSIESIGITSFGRGYTSPAKLLVFDGKTKELVSDIDLSYNLRDSNVKILKNTSNLNNSKPLIIPTQNTNGVGISTISYNSSTKDVTAVLSVGFSTSDQFPFNVGDRVLIENISVGVNSLGKGYNSENYDYNLFTIKSVTPNIGGIGSVSYNISDFITDDEYPGTYNPIYSVGRIIPEKHFPIFDIKLQSKEFFENETVRSNSSDVSGLVEGWDSRSRILKVLSNETFLVGDTITGDYSSAYAKISSNDSFKSTFNVSPYSRVENGSKDNSGFLNDNLQRVQDNFYYQKLSYSIRSKVDYDTWNDVVSTLNHTAGFKKFSDFQMESRSDLENPSVGLTTDLTSFEKVIDLTSFANLNCVHDFDLVKENSFAFNSSTISDEIIFSSRTLSDYFESVGNRVLSIDDISDQFNSNPRSTEFSVVNTFDLSRTRSQKYITYVKDKRFNAQRQLLIVDLVHDNTLGYLNQYGRVETVYDQGSFDFSISGLEGQLLFYPTKSSINDYDITCLSYNIDDVLLGIGSTSIGGVVSIETTSNNLSSGISTTIVGIASTNTSVKVLVQINPDINYTESELVELNILHDGTNIELLDYGQLTTVPTSYATIGLGTYHAYYSGSNLNVDFIPNSGVGIGTTGAINTICIVMANSSSSGVGTIPMKNALLEARTTSIASSVSPSENVIASYSDEYDAAYFIVQVSDTTNGSYQVSEVIVVDDYISSTGSGDTYDTEFGILETVSGLGTIGSRVSGASVGVGATVELVFTPLPGIDVVTNVYMNALKHQEIGSDAIDFTNAIIQTTFSDYTGTERDIRRSFNLTHKNFPIFERYFDGSSSDIVSISENTIEIPNHFFVTGENITYYSTSSDSSTAIGIGTTTFVSIGSTDRLPSSIYVVKVDENKIQLASSAQNALKFSPETLDLVSVGVGTTHRFVSTNQNAKVIVSLDNIIQSPIVSTAITSTLANKVEVIDDILEFTGITSFFGGDLIKVNDEIMKIEGIGIGSTGYVRVRRSWLGTSLAGYSTGSLITKVVGNYNIVDNILNFSEPPYGNIPLGTSTNPPDERDWEGITKGSNFHGRTFLRSGIRDSSDETYHKNYIFDDISAEFDGIQKSFTLKSNGSNVSGISSDTIILINDIFQGRGLSSDYVVEESVGISTIRFTGTSISVSSDPNMSNVPLGGVIVSVASTSGFGYQPLVSSGGTAIVSSGGTIQSISIGNTGSGYRASTSYEILTNTSSTIGIGSTSIYLENENSVFELLNLLDTGSNCTIGVGTFILPTTIVSVATTYVQIGIADTSNLQIPPATQVNIQISSPQIGIVNVGVSSTSVGIVTVTHVGFATMFGGYISTSVNVTNPGSGYTSSNPPYVVIDDPLSYSNIPLIYSSSSPSGFGTEATIDIVVGQGSSVIDFEIRNTGYGYGADQILTIPVGGLTGIQTTSLFQEFQVNVQKTFTDEFTGWSIGELEVLDNIEDLFDDETVSFPLSLSNNLVSIRSSKGSNINVQDVLLVFVNDIWQVPGEGYVFNGGSIITFTEAPKIGDTCKILFYKGSGGVDVVFKDVVETVKEGDELTILHDKLLGQEFYLSEDTRTVTEIKSTDLVETNPYFGPGNTKDENLLRPVLWCRQTEDKIINEKEVSKSRKLYEPLINPFAYLISSVGIGSTVVYVDNIRPFFNQINENDTNLSFQNNVTFISQEEKVGASATAIVSGFGTISSVSIINGGSGYTSATVSFGSTVGVGTTTQAFGNVTIGVGGTVAGIAITSSGFGYTSTNPPSVLISTPNTSYETNPVSSYEGDSGIIVGISTTSVGIAQTGLIFDLYIPNDSFLRDSSVSGVTTISDIKTNYYFIVYNSNIGYGLTTLDSSGNIIGISTTFLDNVYEVASVSIAQTSVIGVGNTYIAKVTVSVSDYNGLSGIGNSNFFGEYSWGRINLPSREKLLSYSAYTTSGVIGISTGTIVKRLNPLRYSNYT